MAPYLPPLSLALGSETENRSAVHWVWSRAGMEGRDYKEHKETGNDGEFIVFRLMMVRG